MKVRKVAFVSDIHAPYHDPSAVELTLKILTDVKPDVLFFGGDIVDCYAVSDFDRDPQRVARFQDEFDCATDIMAKMRRTAKSGLFLPGNHCRRWERFIHRHPELSSLRNSTISEQLQLRKLGIGLLTHGEDYKIGDLFYMHGDESAGGGVFPARSFYLKEQGNCIFGHWHKMQVFYNRLKDGTTHGSFANGCLCLLKQEYVKGTTQWQQGFSIIHYYGEKFRVEQVCFFSDKRKLYGAYGGELYETRLR